MAGRIGQKLGNYRITGSLGRGGFAEVYLAEHMYLKTQAAIKLLYARLSYEEDMENFVKEAQTIAQLSHPHIIRVLDFGVDDEIPYLVMDYAVNGNLRQRFPRGIRVPLPGVVSYVHQIANGLQYAHDKGFIHQDIKPENILLGQNDTLLLSDFGLAKVKQHTLSQKTDYVAGTAQYMSPEQFKGKPRPASDQYALGIMVYEWLCGEPPFAEGDFIQLGFQHTYESVPSLHEKAATISPDVEQVVTTALAKEAKQRFGSVKAFANALEQATGMKQVTGPIAPSSAPLQNASSAVEQQARPISISSASPTPMLPVQDKGEQFTQFDSIPPQPVQRKPLPQSEPIHIANTSTPSTQFSTTNSLGISTGSVQSANDASIFDAKLSNTKDTRDSSVSTSSGLSRVAKPSPQRINIWHIGRQQLIAMLIGIIVYGTVMYFFDRSLNDSYYSFVFYREVASTAFGLLLIIPLFFGAYFGPWVGLGIGLIGLLSGDVLAQHLTFAAALFTFNYVYIGCSMPGFLAGFSLLLTQRNYTAGRSLITAAIIGVVVFIVGISLQIILDGVFFSSFRFFWIPLTKNLVTNMLGILILLPLLLFAYHKITHRNI